MNIGLIAHDSKKKLMQNFCIAYRGILCKNELFATGTTGKLTKNVFTKTGNTFKGWSTTPNGEVKYNDEELLILLNDDSSPIILKSVQDESLIQLILPIKTY